MRNLRLEFEEDNICVSVPGVAMVLLVMVVILVDYRLETAFIVMRIIL